MGYPWITLSHWQPFRIDALGLVTLLGSEEIDTYVGRLVSSRWLDYMPLLGAFVIASDRIREKTNSIRLYDFSSGIFSTDLSPCFTRWMSVQCFETTRSLVYWEIVEEPRKWLHFQLISAAISSCLIGFLMVMTSLSRDWYGFANAFVVAVSVLVRVYVVQANREAIDRSVCRSIELTRKSRRALRGKYLDDLAKQYLEPAEHSKALIIMPDSKAVTMFIPKQLIVPVFTRKPKPHNNALYHLFRWLGWAAFVIHIVTIGMAQLSSQICTVLLLVVPTILACYGVGCDDSTLYKNWRNPMQDDGDMPYICWIGSHLKATVFQWPMDVEFHTDEATGEWRRRNGKYRMPSEERSERRQDLYAWLNLTAEEENSLSRWDLLPHARQNHSAWVADWNDKKALIRKIPVNIVALKDDATFLLAKKRPTMMADIENRCSSDSFPVSNTESQDSRNLDTRLSSGGMAVPDTFKI